MKSGFHSVELNKTVWEVPERYVNLTAIGSGAYGQVSHHQTDGICPHKNISSRFARPKTRA